MCPMSTPRYFPGLIALRGTMHVRVAPPRRSDFLPLVERSNAMGIAIGIDRILGTPHVEPLPLKRIVRSKNLAVGANVNQPVIRRARLTVFLILLIPIPDGKSVVIIIVGVLGGMRRGGQRCAITMWTSTVS